MARALDQIIVVDVEPICWEGPPPEGEAIEIIETGLCAPSVTDGARLGRRSIFVRPERSYVSAYYTQLKEPGFSPPLSVGLEPSR